MQKWRISASQPLRALYLPSRLWWEELRRKPATSKFVAFAERPLEAVTHFSDAKCGKVLALKDDWQFISSPNYEEDGYTENQMCSWILKAPKKERVEIEFVEDFSFLCATTCVDYVELKLAKDQRNTGPRFCCYRKPEKSLISEGHQVAIIFRSQIGQDIGFKLRARASKSMDVERKLQ